MKIRIFGDHTADYGDHPYEIGREFEAALKSQWSAISFFGFDSNNAAEIVLDPKAVVNMTVREVYWHLAQVVKFAADKVDWDIWEVTELV